MKANSKLELFYYDACPFCMMVLSFIQKNSLQVELKNIQSDSQNLSRLLQDTGRRTVPCLYIDNNPMFESMDIIKWLETNLIK